MTEWNVILFVWSQLSGSGCVVDASVQSSPNARRIRTPAEGRDTTLAAKALLLSYIVDTPQKNNLYLHTLKLRTKSTLRLFGTL